MAYKVMHDLGFLSDLISHSSPFYSFCSSHTKFPVLGICWVYSGSLFAVPWPYHGLIFWYGSAPSPFPDLCSDYTALEKTFLPALYIFRVLISTWRGTICWFIHSFIHSCVCMCERKREFSFLDFLFFILGNWNLFITITPELKITPGCYYSLRERGMDRWVEGRMYRRP